MHLPRVADFQSVQMRLHRGQINHNVNIQTQIFDQNVGVSFRADTSDYRFQIVSDLKINK